MTVQFTSNVLAWGRLVKSWATGLDYINTAFTGQPPPATATIPAHASWQLPAPTPVVKGQPAGVTIPLVVTMSIAEFGTLLQGVQITDFTPPSGIQNVVVVQGDDTTMVLRLPAKSFLQQSETDLKIGDYRIPPFYNQLYPLPDGGGVLTAVMPTGYPDKMQLHANRIGDYTMTSCN